MKEHQTQGPSQSDIQSTRELVKGARIALRVSRTDLALALGISREKLYNLEEGRTPIRADMLVRYKAFFEASKAAADLAIQQLAKRGVL